jgi:hypothetical protein
LKNFHGEDSPGIFQVGNINIASCITGQANVQNPKKLKKKKQFKTPVENTKHANITYFSLFPK